MANNIPSLTDDQITVVRVSTSRGPSQTGKPFSQGSAASEDVDLDKNDNNDDSTDEMSK